MYLLNMWKWMPEWVLGAMLWCGCGNAVRLTRDTVVREVAEGGFLPGEEPLREQFIRFGPVVPLGDPRFNKNAGSRAAWEPYHFMHDTGAGVFQLQPFESGKLPVIFVHGFSGYPKEFTTMIESMDRSTYQPWVVQYPSGWSLKDVVWRLRRGLNDMFTHFGVQEAYVVAHSMGGLVGWGMLARTENDAVLNVVKGLVTIASPMAGMASAGEGARRSPIVLPVWRDLDPQGDFIRFVSTHKPNTRYALFYTQLPDKDGDGVVPLHVQLPEHVRSHAEQTLGFALEHAGSLQDPALIGALYETLNRWHR